jgi:cold shock protein
MSLRAERAAPLTAGFTHFGKYIVRGTVKFFNTAKGYGFIAPEGGGKDVFVHATALEQAGIHSLNEGDRVSFELEDDRRGRGKQAGQLRKE